MSTKEFQAANCLVNYLAGLDLLPSSVITIDGDEGAGKTHLATMIVGEVNAVHIGLDRFLNKNEGAFFECLRMCDLEAEMTETLESGAVVVLEGVQVERVVEELNLDPHPRIYIKRMNMFGEWEEQRIFTSFQTPDKAISNEESALRRRDKALGRSRQDCELSPLFKEIIHYHYEFQPFVNPDIVLERSEL